MLEEYNIYCDESCHLEHDHQPVMVIGAVWVPKPKVKKISKDIKEIKKNYNARGELKWAKVSPSKIDFYRKIVNYFFENPNLHFRCIVVSNKERLNHEFFNKGSHDSFYYKMYFYLLREILKPDKIYNIYLDIKDTRSNWKIQKLREILLTNFYDFEGKMIRKIQHIRSHESVILQLADFLLGAVSYRARNLQGNKAKIEVVQAIESFAAQSLNISTPPWEEKFNIFVFTPKEVKGGS